MGFSGRASRALAAGFSENPLLREVELGTVSKELVETVHDPEEHCAQTLRCQSQWQVHVASYVVNTSSVASYVRKLHAKDASHYNLQSPQCSV